MIIFLPENNYKCNASQKISEGGNYKVSFKKYLLIVLFFLFSSCVYGHHLKGGWIQYQYLGRGSKANTSRYKITVKQYLLCSSGDGQIDNNIFLGIFDGSNNSLINTLQVPLNGTQFETKSSYGCVNPSSPVCYRVDRYITTMDLPNNNGGYILSVQRCCRVDGIINLIGSDSTGLTYTNKIPGIINGVSYRNNSSPVFAQRDTVVICQNNFFSFDFSATDADGDDLTYAFTYGLKGGDTTNAGIQPNPPIQPYPPYDSTVSVNYSPGYSYISPLGSGVTIDPNTGIVSGYAPATMGDYVIAVAVNEYRGNVLIGTTRKEIHVNVAACTVLYAITSQVNVQCLSGPTGSATATGTGGIAPYSYSWNTSPVQTSATATGLSAGSYTVTISDSNSCTTSKTITIQAIPKDPAATNNGPVCAGGTINLSSTTISGTDYKWTGPNGFTSSIQNPVLTNVQAANAGVYTVSTTINNCGGASSSTTVVVNPLPASPTASNNGSLCSGATLNLSASSTPGASYLWTGPNNFTSSQQNPSINNVTNLNAGTYSVTVTVNGCTSLPATTTVIVNSIPSIPSISSNSPVCAGATLNLSTPSVSGGVYNWTGPNFNSALQNPVVNNINNSGAGTYYLNLLVNGCRSATDSVVVAVRALPATPVISSNSPVCQGAILNLNSSIVVGATYSWSGPNSYSSSSQNNVITNVQPSAAGNYQLIATSGGCNSVPASVSVIINPLPIPTASNNGPLCVGGTLNLFAAGTIGGTYQWTGPAGFSSTMQNPSIGVATSLNAGNYNLIQTIAGCSSTGSITTVVVNNIPPSSIASNNSPVCSGSSVNLNGTTISGATYSWAGPNGFSSTQQNPVISNATNLNSGSYTLSTFLNGCGSNSSTTLVVVNDIPVSPNISNNGPLCAGNNLQLSAVAVPGGRYNWTGPNGFSSSLQNPVINNVSNINAGDYSLTITINGCTSNSSTTTVVITTPPVSSPSSNTPLCSGSTLNLSASSLTQGNYNWTGPNSFSSNLQNPTINNVTAANAGSYFLRTSLNGCFSEAFSTSVVINPIPAAPTVSNNGPLCANTTLNLSASNFNGAMYSWTGPNGFTSSLQNPSILNVTSVNSGTYSVTTSVNGCISTSSSTTVTINDLPATPVVSNNGPLCSGSTLNLSTFASSGFSYSWSGPNGFTSQNMNPVISNVSAIHGGSYSLTVSSNGCSSLPATTVVVINSLPATPVAGNDGPVCENSSLNLSTNVIQGLSYTWTGPNGFTSNVTNPTLTNITVSGAGIYSVIASSNGCNSSAGSTTVVVKRNPLTPAISNNGPLCEGSTLQLKSNASSGVTCSWSGPAGFSSNVINPTLTGVTNINAGDYTMIVDSNGCKINSNITRVIIHPIPATAAVSNNGPLCRGSSIMLSASTVAGATYNWTGPNGFISAVQNPIIPNANSSNSGTYSVVTSMNGCNGLSSSTIVNVNAVPENSVASNNGPICEGATLNLSTSSINGASYNWTGPNGFTSSLQNPSIANATIANAGSYLLVTNVAGCPGNGSSTSVTVNQQPAASIASGTTPLCEGATLNLTASTVTGATYSWSGPNGFSSVMQNPVITNSTASNAGTYLLKTLANGCSGNSTSITIVINSIPAPSTASNNGPLCSGTTLNLYGSSVAGVSYNWTGPNGFVSSVQNPFISNISSINAGTYSLNTMLNGCNSPATSTTVIIFPVTESSVAGNNGPVCSGNDLQLTGTTINGATYNWSGPNGFVSTSQNPIIHNVNGANAGTYTLRTSVNGCNSNPSSSTVIINEVPATASASSNGPVCSGSTLFLYATSVPGATYLWTGPAGFTSTLQNPVVNNVSSVNGGTYNVVTFLNGCSSLPATTDVIIKNIPSGAIASSNGPLCEGATLSLSATNVTGATYSWSGPNGFSSGLQNPTISNVTINDSGTYILTSSFNGCTANSSSTFVLIHRLPATPVVSNNGPLCNGSTLQLTASSDSAVIYNWNGPGGFISSTQNPVVSNASLSNSGTYSVIATANGCSSLMASTNVIVNPIPETPIVSNNGPLCEGSVLNLSSTNISGASYNWTGPNGFLSSIQNPNILNVSSNAGGSYILTVFVNGCYSIPASTSVVINSIPAKPVISNNGPLCAGATLKLSASDIPGVVYNWVGPNGFTSTIQNPSIQNVSVANAGNYKVISIANGCSSVSDSSKVVVNQIPSTPSTSNNGPLCAGSILHIYAAGDSGTTYRWIGPNGFASGRQNITILNAGSNNAGIYYVTSSLNGCSSLRGSSNVIVNEIPPEVSVSNNGPLCPGSQLNLSASAIANATYHWTGPNGFSSNLQNPEIAHISYADSGSYFLSIIVNNCTSRTVSTMVVVKPTPTSPSVSNNGPLCEGADLQLIASGESTATYSWSGPNNFTSNLQNPVVSKVSLSDSGSYQVTKIIDGCNSSPSATNVIINQKPSSPIAFNDGPVCEGSILNLSASAQNGASYNWTGPNNFVSSLQNPVFSNIRMQDSGIYNLVISVSGCVSLPSSTKVVVKGKPGISLAANNGPVCSGSILNLYSSSITGVTYNWTGPGGFNSNMQNPAILNVTELNNGFYYVRATLDGCVGDSAGTNVIIHTLPTMPVVSNNGPLCAGSTLNLIASDQAGATFNWSGPNGFTSTIQNPIIENAGSVNQGSYTVFTSKDGCSGPIAETKVIVNDVPVNPAVSNNGPLCAGATLNLISSASAGAVYNWTGPAGFASDLQNPVINNTDTLNSGIYFLVISKNGCSASPVSTNVIINGIPPMAIASNNGPVCEGSILSLIASDVTGVSYNWTGPNGFSSSLQKPFVNNASLVNGGTYLVTTNSKGCTSNSSATTVIVNAIPERAKASSNSPLCSGSVLKLFATNVSGASYTWTGPNGFNSSLQNPVINNISSASSGSYVVTTTVNGCSTSGDTTNVIVNSTPASSTISVTSPVCSGTFVNLTATDLIGASYSWTGPNGFVSTLQNPVIYNATSANAGIYSLVTVVNGCSSLASTDSLVVNQIPLSPAVTSNAPICSGSTLEIQATAIADANYYWNGPDGFVATSQNVNIGNVTVANAGKYSVISKIKGCSSLPTDIDVVIYKIPEAAQISGNGPLCMGSTLNLYASSIPATTYTWTGPAGFSSNLQNPSLSNVNLSNGGTYKVFTKSNGCVGASSEIEIVVNELPPAAVASGNGPLCAGSTLNLLASNVAGASYSWTGPNGFSSILQNPIISNVSSIQSGTYEVVTNKNGCTGNSSSVSVTINNIPATPVTSNNGPVCEGEVLNLSAESVSGATYYWSGPNGFSSILQNPVLENMHLVNEGSYTVIATVNNCSSPASSTGVVVRPLPEKPVVSNNGPLCEGGSLQLASSTAPGVMYNWSGPNGFNSSLQNPSKLNVTSSDAGIYRLNIFSNGCSSDTSLTTVTVNQIPASAVPSSNGPVCEGTTLNLFASGVNGVAYNWQGPNGFNSNLQNPVIPKASSLNSGTYSVSTSSNGCESTVSSILVTVNNLPPIPSTSNNGPLCFGSTLDLSASAITGASYSWKGPDGFVSSLQNPQIQNVSLNNSGSYILAVTLNGCSSYSDSSIVVVNAIPSQPLLSNNGSVCSGNEIKLFAAADQGATYVWSGPNGFSSNQQNPVIENATIINAGVYSCKSIVNGCISNPSFTTVVVNQIPAAPTVSNNGPLCSGTNLNLMSSFIEGVLYTWTGPNAFYSTEQNPVIKNVVNENAGTYSVTATFNGCISNPSLTAVIINPIPAKTVASNSGPLCSGSTLHLIASTISDVSYLWTGPNGYISHVQNPSIDSVSTLQSGTYYVHTISNGCSSESDSTIVNVNEHPATAIASNNGPVCSGTDLILSASAIPGVTYSWTGPNGYRSGLQNPVINNVQNKNAGEYFVTTSLNGCDGKTTTTTVVVNAIPESSVASNNGPVCSGATLNLFATPVTSATYKWEGPDGYSSEEQNPVLQNANAINGGVYLLKVFVNGCSSLSTSTTVIINSIPDTAVVTNNGPLCAGGTLQLSASTIDGFSYHWTGPNGFISAEQRPTIPNVTSINAGTYSLISELNGCKSMVARTSVVINDNPSSITIHNNGPVCAGSTLQLFASDISGATYQWSGPNGFSSTIQNPVIANATSANAGFYSVIVTNNGCSLMSDSSKIVVNEIPAASVVSNNGPLCSDSDLNLFATDVAGASYTWNGPNGFTSSLQNPVISNVTSIEAGLYSVRTSSNGCAGPVSSTTIIIHETPSAPIASNNGPLCAGADLKLSASNMLDVSYSWTGPNHFISSLQNPVIANVDSIAAGSYSVTSISNGCSSMASITTVVINPLPKNIVLSNNGPLCAGSTLRLTASYVEGANYRWTGPNGFTSSEQNPSINNSKESDAGSYNLVIISNGCASFSNVTDVIVNSIPEAPVANNNGPLCIGSTLKLFASNVAGAIYKWSGPNGFVSTDQNPLIPNADSSNSGLYTLQINVNGCSSMATNTAVKINNIPSAAIVSSNGPLCAGSDLQLTASGVEGVSYNWTGPNNFSSTEQNPKINNAGVVNAGSYVVTTSSNGCAGAGSSIMVSIIQVPEVPIASSNGPLCTGADLQLTGKAADSVQFLWAGPNGFVSAMQNPIINNVSSINSGIYSLTVSYHGCTSLASKTEVVTKEIPAADSIFNNGPLCEGSVLNLTAAAISGATYIWSGPNGFRSDLQNPVINDVNILNAGNYSLTITSNGCTGPASNTLLIVNQLPATPIASNNGPLCSGGSLHLLASVVIGATYIWSGPDNFISREQNPVVTGISKKNEGIYTVTTYSNGCSGKPSTTSVIINEIVSSSIASNNGPVCAGDTLNLFASTIPGASYSWTGPAGFSSAEQNPSILNVSETNSGDYLLITKINNCQSNISSTSVLVKKIPLPVTANNNGPLCPGATLQLSASDADGTYIWSGPNGFTSSLQNPVIMNVNSVNNGLYGVTVFSNGCTSSAAVTEVVIKSLIDTPAISTNSPVCSGGTLQLNATFVAGAGYHWTGPNNFVSTEQNPVISNVSNLNSGLYSLVVTLGGCQSIIAKTSVLINPIMNGSVVSSNGPVCSGSTLKLFASSYAGGVYNWSGPSGFTSSEQNPVLLNATELNSGTYVLHVTTNGCSMNESQTEVVVMPVVPTPVAISNSPVCSGGNILLSTIGDSLLSYNWTGPLGFISTVQNPVITHADSSNSGTYTVQIFSKGCSSKISSVAVKINSMQAPVISNNGPVCEGGKLQLFAASVPDASYSWSGPGGFVSNVPNPEIDSVTLAAAGKYILSTRVNNCNSLTATTLVLVNKLPNTPVVNNNGPVCSGSTLILHASGDSGSVYLWTGPNGFISTSKDPVIINSVFNNSGKYSVTASLNGCKSKSNETVAQVHEVLEMPVASSNSAVCVGSTLYLYATTIPGASYHWRGPDGFTSNKQNPVTKNVQMDDAGIYYVSVSMSGCWSNESSTNVVVNPIVASPVASSNGPVCEGGTIKLFVTSITGTTYFWTGPNGFTSTDQNPIITNATVKDAGKYSVTISSNGCSSNTSSTEVIIKTSAGGAVITYNSPLCSGGTLRLFASGVAADSYQWSGPKGFSSTLKNPVIENVDSSNSGIYYLVNNINNCTNSPVSISIKVNGTVSTPVVLANGPVCEGSSIQLNVVNSAGGTYQWNGPNGFISDKATVLIPNATISNAGTYHVIHTENGCSSLETEIDFTVNKLPGSKLITSNDPVCEGGVLVLQIADSIGEQYSWSGPAGFISHANKIEINSVSLLNSGMYTLAVSSNGCTGPVNKQNVKINPSPDLPLVNSNDKLCEGDSLVFNTSATDPDLVFTWNGPNGFTSHLKNPKIMAVKNIHSGMYTLQVSKNSCESKLANLMVNVNKAPQSPEISVNSPLCEGGELKLSVSQEINTTYNWTGPNNFTSSAASTGISNIDLINNGVYKVIAWQNGCKSEEKNIAVVINKLPVIDKIFNNGPVCAGGDLLLQSGINSGSSLTSLNYVWSGPNGFSSSNSNPVIINVDSIRSGRYQLTVLDNGCASSPAFTQVVINNREIIFAGTDKSFCSGTGIVDLHPDIKVDTKILWTSSGTGTFSPNNTTPNALYLLSNGDKSNSKILLTLKTTDSLACPANPSTVSINILPSTILHAGDDQKVCNNSDTIFLSGISNTNHVMWSTTGDGKFIPEAVNINAKYLLGPADRSLKELSFILSSTDSLCPTKNDSTKIVFLTSPLITFLQNNEVLKDEYYTIHPQIKGDIISYLWSPADNLNRTDISDPIVKGVADKMYQLEVKDRNGCSATGKIMINVLQPLLIPNTFTPNGDGINDEWKVDFLYQYKNCKVQVFNRYGQIVFQSSGYTKPWNGTFKGQALPAGTYYYIIEIGHGKPGITGYVTIVK